MHFFYEDLFKYFDGNCTEVSSWESNIQALSIGSGIGLITDKVIARQMLRKIHGTTCVILWLVLPDMNGASNCQLMSTIIMDVDRLKVASYIIHQRSLGCPQGHLLSLRWISHEEAVNNEDYFWLLTTPATCTLWLICGRLYCVFQETGINDIDGLVQERRNSSALTMELRLSCTNPLIWFGWPLFCCGWIIISS